MNWIDGVPPDFAGQDHALIAVEIPSRFSDHPNLLEAKV